MLLGGVRGFFRSDNQRPWNGVVEFLQYYPSSSAALRSGRPEGAPLRPEARLLFDRCRHELATCGDAQVGLVGEKPVVPAGLHTPNLQGVILANSTAVRPYT